MLIFIAEASSRPACDWRFWRNINQGEGPHPFSLGQVMKLKFKGRALNLQHPVCPLVPFVEGALIFFFFCPHRSPAFVCDASAYSLTQRSVFLMMAQLSLNITGYDKYLTEYEPFTEGKVMRFFLCFLIDRKPIKIKILLVKDQDEKIDKTNRIEYFTCISFSRHKDTSRNKFSFTLCKPCHIYLFLFVSSCQLLRLRIQ